MLSHTFISISFSSSFVPLQSFLVSGPLIAYLLVSIVTYLFVMLLLLLER